MLRDHGHQSLLADLEQLLADAARLRFHDHDGEPEGKMELRRRLRALLKRAEDGDYANRQTAGPRVGPLPARRRRHA